MSQTPNVGQLKENLARAGVLMNQGALDAALEIYASIIISVHQPTTMQPSDLGVIVTQALDGAKLAYKGLNEQEKRAAIGRYPHLSAIIQES